MPRPTREWPARPGGERQPPDQDEEPSGPVDLGTREEPEQVAIAARLASSVVAEVEHRSDRRMFVHRPFDLAHRLEAVFVHLVVLA